jgi:uncharacterized protein
VKIERPVDVAFVAALSKLGANRDIPKRIAVTGSNGLIGSRVVSLLSTLGHHVIKLERPKTHSAPTSSTRSERIDSSERNIRSVVWHPQRGLDSPESLEGIDAVIHLAGKSIGDHRWTERVKAELTSSRVEATSILARQLSGLARPPEAFVCASGVGIYGDRGNRVIDEREPPANDFLGSLAERWEQACSSLSKAGTRVCYGRLGVVLARQGGAFAKMLPLFRFGLGGKLGSGKQYWSWIGHDDASCAFIWLALNPSCQGPYNLAGGSVTNAQFTQDLARALRRPAFLPVPGIVLRILLGEMADGLLLNSTRAIGSRLIESGFPMRQIDLMQTFRELLGVQ